MIPVDRGEGGTPYNWLLHSELIGRNRRTQAANSSRGTPQWARASAPLRWPRIRPPCDRRRRERQNSTSSASLILHPGFATTTAFGTSPHFWSATGITAAS